VWKNRIGRRTALPLTFTPAIILEADSRASALTEETSARHQTGGRDRKNTEPSSQRMFSGAVYVMKNS